MALEYAVSRSLHWNLIGFNAITIAQPWLHDIDVKFNISDVLEDDVGSSDEDWEFSVMLR